MDFEYLWVCTGGQRPERQLDGVALDRRFVDTADSRLRDRPQLAALLDQVRSGDTIHVHSFGRLARSLPNLLELVGTITGRGVTLRFHRPGLSFEGGAGTTLQQVQRQMPGAVAELERARVVEQAAVDARAAAMARGESVGRPAALAPVQVRRGRVAHAAGQPVAAIALDLDVSRPVVYRALVERPAGDGST